LSNHNYALITGATSGIGYEFSRVFAANGYNVVLVARNQPRLTEVVEALKNEFGIKAESIPQDLSDPQAPIKIYNELQQRSIQIDALVNNAGFNEYGPFCVTRQEHEQEMLQVNIASLTFLTKLLLPGMISRHHGKILNLGSIGSYGPGPLNAVYCATKAYVLSFSEALAEELQGTGVDVSVLCPGATDTEFAKRAQMENTNIFKGPVMDARTVAETGFKGLMQGKTIVIPGLRNRILVFMLRFTPRKTIVRMSKQMMSAS